MNEYMAAIKKAQAQTKQQTVAYTSIEEIYQKLLTAMSHLNNACAILSD